MFSLCEFCNSRFAVLYCDADSASLCLQCDRHVHSANTLSLKHTRLWICANCGRKPVWILCSNNGLILCRDCDSDDSHTTCSISGRPVEAFSGCPSATVMASTLGFSLEDISTDFSYSGPCLDEQKPANIHGFVGSADGCSVCEGWSLGRGKTKKEVCEQLVEMTRRDLLRVDVDGIELGPKTPPNRLSLLGNSMECLVQGNKDDDNSDGLLERQTTFTSLLALSTSTKLKQSVSADEEDLLWDYNPTYDSSLIWDFQWEKSKDCEDAGSQASEYGLDRPCLLTPKYEISSVLDDALSENTRSNRPLSNDAPTARERTNKQSVGSVTELDLAKSKNCDLLSARNYTAKEPKSKEDVDMLAQNRGNAMRRYMEKKKARRYDKRICYESRKARADARKRVKGRFVKSNEAPNAGVSKQVSECI